MRELNLYLDMTEDDLARLFLLARRHHEHSDNLTANDIRVGECYSNGALDDQWAVRRVTAERDGGLVAYREISGPGAPREGACSRDEFAAWAHHRVDTASLAGS